MCLRSSSYASVGNARNQQTRLVGCLKVPNSHTICCVCYPAIYQGQPVIAWSTPLTPPAAGHHYPTLRCCSLRCAAACPSAGPCRSMQHCGCWHWGSACTQHKVTTHTQCNPTTKCVRKHMCSVCSEVHTTDSRGSCQCRPAMRCPHRVGQWGSSTMQHHKLMH